MESKNIFLIVAGIVIIGAFVFFTIQENKKPEEKVDLYLKLKAGEHYDMRIANHQRTTQTYKDKMLQVDEKSDDVLSFDVISVEPNGTMNIAFKYKTVKMEANTPGQKITFDSAKKPVETNDIIQTAINEVGAAVMAGQYSFKISPKGRKEHIQGFDVVRAKLADHIKEQAEKEINDESASEKDKEAFAVLQKGFLERIVKEKIAFYNNFLNSIADETQQKITFIFLTLPYKPVGAESKWYEKLVFHLGMNVDANTTYIYKKKENGNAFIDIISDVDMGKKFKVIDISSRETVSKTITGTRWATNVIDAQTGLLQRSEATIKYNGVQHIETDKATLPIRPNMDIKLRIEGSTIVELIKGNL
ncbi:MAG: hypothetical protein A2Y12_18125 [Planctomycetes bacterium GWF2_42_9]|nr:MAG: hypothetical protein A2Y12_18125 [Planctomycetes bacterium GWF2_42_9]HAL44601.1 hypothetical protein [Phycisphaerales bacterium]